MAGSLGTAGNASGVGAWQGRPNGPVEAPSRLMQERSYWLEVDPTVPGAETLRDAALEIIGLARREERETERRLAAIGRTLMLPKEQQVGNARARTWLDALDVLHGVHQRLLGA